MVSSTATHSNVAVNVASVTLLAANNVRRGVSIYNDSPAGATLYVKLGTTASATDFWVAIKGGASATASGGYAEVPFGYVGRIDGIWSGADAAGAARIVEFT